MSTDIDIGVIQTTQKVLGKYIKKPPLTEKLLRKPPFRFLHDILTSVVRETGFLKGLYSERELVSENVKEKEDKITFLNKLIDAVKTITGIKLSVRAAKVIAGLEPQETNALLQAVATALDRKLDSSTYISELKSSKKTPQTNDKLKQDKSKTKSKNTINLEHGSNVKKDPGKKLVSVSKSRAKEKTSSSRDSKDSTKNDASKHKSKTKKTEKLVTPHGLIERSELPAEETNHTVTDDKELAANVEHKTIIENGITENETTPEINIENSKNVGPNDSTTDNNSPIEVIKSARPRTATIKKKADTSNLIAPIIPQVEQPFVRPRSSLRPPTVRPSSARPGAPRLRFDSTVPEGEVIQLGKVNVIVENYDSKEIDEEETVTIEPAPELEYQQPIIELPTDKGHLVDQILKEINKDEFAEHAKPVVNIEWEQDGLRSRNAATKEIEQLRSAIQTLTRTANPLGKLVNYLHEDIEAMHTELDSWINTTRQIMTEIASHKRLSAEANKPLQQQLEEIDNNIVKHQQQIVSISGNIMRNEQRIKELLLSKI